MKEPEISVTKGGYKKIFECSSKVEFYVIYELFKGILVVFQ